MNINNLRIENNTSSKYNISVIIGLIIKLLGLCILIFNYIKLNDNNNISLVKKSLLLDKIVKMNEDNKLFYLFDWLSNTLDKLVNYFSAYPLRIMIIMSLIISIAIIIDIFKIINSDLKSRFFYKLINIIAMSGSLSSINSIYCSLKEYDEKLNVRLNDVVLDFVILKLVFRDTLLEKKNVFINNYLNKLNELFLNKNLMDKDNFESFINGKKEMLNNFLTDNYILGHNIEDIKANAIKLAYDDYNSYLKINLSYTKKLLNIINNALGTEVGYDKIIMGLIFGGLCVGILYYFNGKLNVINNRLNVDDSKFDLIDSRYNLFNSGLSINNNSLNEALVILEYQKNQLELAMIEIGKLKVVNLNQSYKLDELKELKANLDRINEVLIVLLS